MSVEHENKNFKFHSYSALSKRIDRLHFSYIYFLLYNSPKKQQCFKKHPASQKKIKPKKPKQTATESNDMISLPQC